MDQHWGVQLKKANSKRGYRSGRFAGPLLVSTMANPNHWHRTLIVPLFEQIA
mgnify:CR=1 FL=1